MLLRDQSMSQRLVAFNNSSVSIPIQPSLTCPVASALQFCPLLLLWRVICETFPELLIAVVLHGANTCPRRWLADGCRLCSSLCDNALQGEIKKLAYPGTNTCVTVLCVCAMIRTSYFTACFSHEQVHKPSYIHLPMPQILQGTIRFLTNRTALGISMLKGATQSSLTSAWPRDGQLVRQPYIVRERV